MTNRETTLFITLVKRHGGTTSFGTRHQALMIILSEPDSTVEHLAQEVTHPNAMDVVLHYKRRQAQITPRWDANASLNVSAAIPEMDEWDQTLRNNPYNRPHYFMLHSAAAGSRRRIGVDLVKCKVSDPVAGVARFPSRPKLLWFLRDWVEQSWMHAEVTLTEWTIEY